MVAPKACTQASSTNPYIIVLTMLPVDISAIRRGDRSASRIVVIALLSCGTTSLWSFGRYQISAPTIERITTTITTTCTIVDAGTSVVWIDVGDSTSETPKRLKPAMSLARAANTAPAATAAATPTPCFWRKRTPDTWPPTPGATRLENDVESCCSLVRQNGSGLGTVPMSTTAVAMFVANDTSRAIASHQGSADLMVFQKSPGSPI